MFSNQWFEAYVGSLLFRKGRWNFALLHPVKERICAFLPQTCTRLRPRTCVYAGPTERLVETRGFGCIFPKPQRWLCPLCGDGAFFARILRLDLRHDLVFFIVRVVGIR
jgi:hypothetical protein